MSSGVLIIILVFVALFSMLYIANLTGHGLTPTNWSTMTTPKISEEQAVNAVAGRLQEKLVGFEDYGIYMSGEGYKYYSDFKARRVSIPLLFTHQNGTMYFVNGTTHEILGSCTNTEENVCGYSPNLVNESRGRLVYVLDVAIDSTEDACSGPDIFMVDAISGDIVFSFIDERPETIQKQCLRTSASLD